ncbi:GNAT family N-acetyltransferase [Priestia megaterium]|jgi:ribosomal protein S18 acetylase RimI-like enzyme|uniref:GNAT family N-acetyltransferase n=1 Tax=Priestia megaterium TaxID=1404 RepID=UPI00070D11DA|nr:GNAT family N-acetyltransferase [Priestia megaterium]KRD91293.1 GNAT family acetyltransferase [Bacillus sp. Root147]MDI3090390.1 GNAT family N-acetyltransferase [Priestia megaterium]MED3864666.1 GNAT family N-acetyltransferase [Priestia megaterium]MED4097907.1 GNAT family N-acetyltransferase [Priestia megaterium]MED4141807.1 GNAT family N-acetyltransferase [Priestia megaterium]
MDALKEQYYIEVPESLNPEQQKMMIELEKDAFPGMGAVDEQTLVPLARYGKLIQYFQENDARPIAICELLRDYKDVTKAYIFGFYVRSDKQGSGIGQLFLEEIFSILQKDNFESVCLTVNVKNEGAVKLYKKMGFTIKETRAGEFGEGEDRYYMVRSIS